MLGGLGKGGQSALSGWPAAVAGTHGQSGLTLCLHHAAWKATLELHVGPARHVELERCLPRCTVEAYCTTALPLKRPFHACFSWQCCAGAAGRVSPPGPRRQRWAGALLCRRAGYGERCWNACSITTCIAAAGWCAGYGKAGLGSMRHWNACTSATCRNSAALARSMLHERAAALVPAAARAGPQPTHCTHICLLVLFVCVTTIQPRAGAPE